MAKLDKQELNKFKFDMKIKYKTREDKNNVFGVGLTDTEFRKYIVGILLGENWHIADPLSQEQTNELAIYNILDKLDKKWRKRV